MKKSQSQLNVLVAGGAGYIGSHVVKLLIKEKINRIVILDNLSKGYKDAVLGGVFIHEDLIDQKSLSRIIKKYEINMVIHLAAHIDVAESMKKPILYFSNNILSGLSLLEAMRECSVKKIVFSSSAAVYGEPKISPIKENHPKNPSNIYGLTKLEFEDILNYYHQNWGLEYISLRYFNAAGADPEGQLGERHDPETHLIPVILNKIILDKDSLIPIYGTDYSTPDGTCIRDFVHVEDLARAHFLSIEYLQKHGGKNIFNLGMGHGYSVREVIESCQKVTNINIKTVEKKRRIGDPAILVADCTMAKKNLNWEPKYDLYQMIDHAWKFLKKS